MRRATTTGAVALVLSLAGCQATPTGSVVRTNEPVRNELTSFGDAFQGLKTISDTEYYASDLALAEAKNQFRQENYGNAGAFFYKASQLALNDGEAWLGLGASCDRIRRFDLSDYAYRKAYPLVGNTPAYHNNVGYSYLLRGKLQEARQSFLKAYELAPNDPTIRNNLELLASSVKAVERS